MARSSPHVNQQSGVSVRASIACMETMVSSAERRGIVLGEAKVWPRISDLEQTRSGCRGKIELMLAEDEQAEDKLITALLGEAVKKVAEDYLDVDDLESVVQQFQGAKVNSEVGDDVKADAIISSARRLGGLLDAAREVCRKADLPADEPGELASAVEFVLEALYVNNRLSKYAYRGSTFYKR